MLVGIGYDVHRMVKGRRLVLGGVEIDSPLGLAGHSDADVVIHAVCDAVLGAAALAGEKGLKANNLDVVIIAQVPKLGGKKLEMRDVMARLLGISPDRVNVKATTTEGLDDIGEGKGIAAQAVVSLSGV